MKIRIILPDGYHDRYGRDHKNGDVVDFPEHIATKLIRFKFAEKAKVTAKPTPAPVIPEPETAAIEPAENAMQAPAPKRKGKRR